MATEKRQRKQSLPHDLITYIILRLPAKSLVPFRCVSKEWHSLITSPEFITKHLKHAHHRYNNRHSVVVLSSEQTIQFLHYDEASTGNVVPLDFPVKHSKGFEVLGSCNGLLCILIYQEAIVLWNPSTREHKKLPVVSPVGGPEEFFGFGCDFSINDYKVVRFATDEVSEETTAEIYTLRMDSWKKIGGIPFEITCSDPQERGMLANGALYWPVTQKFLDDTVIRFDSRDERFMVVPLPLPRDLAKGVPLVSLGVYGGCLCVGQALPQQMGVEIWALKEDSSLKFSSCKLMTIPRMEGMQPKSIWVPICLTKNGEVLMNIQQKQNVPHEAGDAMLKEFYLYNPDKKTFKKLLICGLRGCIWDEDIIHIESLVSPNGVGTLRIRSWGSDCFLGGCLCIIFRPDVEWETESLWALKEDGMNFSWSELMTIPPLEGSWPRLHYCIPICFRNNGDVLMQIERDWMFEDEDVWLKKFYLYNPVKKIFKRCCLTKDVWMYEDEDDVWTEKFYLYNPIKETFKRCLAKDVWMYEDEDVWNEEATHIESLVSPNGVGRER